MKLIKSFCNFFKKFIPQDIIVVPQQGDVIEDKEGFRFLVYESTENSVYISNGLDRFPNVRGRSRHIVSLKEIQWPSDDYILYRGNKLLYPQNNYKLSFIVWLSNKILK